VLIKADIMGGGRQAAQQDLKGVTHATNIPQLRLEPILARSARERNPARVLFHHEFVSLTQNADGVEAVVLDRSAGTQFHVRSKYLIAADGGKNSGPSLGVNMIGPTRLWDYAIVYISADFSQYIDDDTSVMRIIMHPTRLACSIMPAAC